MIETPRSVAIWAAETFGPAQSRASMAARANREMAELLQELADDDNSRKAAKEITDIFIILYRLIDDLDLDVWSEIDRVMAINRQRKWTVSPHGHGQHVVEPAE